MVDFSSPKRAPQRRSGPGLLIAAICIIGWVGYALLENTLSPAFAGTSGTYLTDTAPT